MEASDLPNPAPPLLERLRRTACHHACSRRTVQAYVHWVRAFILFHGKRHPSSLGQAEIEAFLAHLGQERGLPQPVQRQALGAVAFLYRFVLELPLDVRRADPGPAPWQALPTPEAVAALLGQLRGARWLAGALQYGSGLRLAECLALRVRDLDLLQRRVIVRQGAGRRDRLALLPEGLWSPLQLHLDQVRRLYAADLGRGHGASAAPAAREWGWQFLFPSSRVGEDGRRQPMDPATQARALVRAAAAAGLRESVDEKTLRHCFSAHLLAAGTDPELVRAALGRGEREARLRSGQGTLRSPFDLLPSEQRRAG